MDSTELQKVIQKFGPMPPHANTAATSIDPDTVIQNWCEYLHKVNNEDPELAAKLLCDPTSNPTERDRALPEVFAYFTKLSENFEDAAVRLRPGHPFWTEVFAIGRLPQVRNDMHRANAMTALRTLITPPASSRADWEQNYPGDEENIHQLEDKLFKAEPAIWRALSDLFSTLNETFRIPFAHVKTYLNDSVLYRLAMVWDGEGEENTNLTRDDIEAIERHVNTYLDGNPGIHGFLTQDQYEKHGFELDTEGWIRRTAGTTPVILSNAERAEIERNGRVRRAALFRLLGRE